MNAAEKWGERLLQNYHGLYGADSYTDEAAIKLFAAALMAFAASETAAKEAAEQRANRMTAHYDAMSASEFGLRQKLVAAEAERDRAVRALQEILADQSIDWIMGGRLRAIAERGVSPVPVPAPQKCPTCGHDVRCIHGIDFRDKCETCEAIESYYEAGPVPTKENQ